MTVYVNGVNQSDSESSVVDAKGDLILGSAADSLGRLAVGSNGMVPTANSGDTLGVGYAYPEIGGLDGRTRALTSIKAATYDPLLATGTFALADGVLYLSAIYLPFDVTLTGVGWFQTTAGDTTADNNNRIGLCTADATNLTLVASCADDGTLWEGAVGVKQKAFSATYAAQAGVYWVAAISNWSAVATAPQLAQLDTAIDQGSFQAPLMTNANQKIMGITTAQTDLPNTTLAWTSTAVTTVNPMFFVY